MFTLVNYSNIIDHDRDPYHNRVPILGGIPDHDRVSDPEMAFENQYQMETTIKPVFTEQFTDHC